MEYEDKRTTMKKSNLLRKTKSDYLDNDNDCLTDAFITIYKNSLWCIQSIYDLIFKSLWPILLLTKENYQQIDFKTMNSIDLLSLNNSARKNDSEMKHSHHRLPRSNSQHSREKSSSKINLLSNKTRVTVRSISNLNLNRTDSNHTSLTEQRNLTNTLGTLNSHIVVVPVPSSHCQNRTSTNDSSDLKQPENMNLRDQLADTLCRRSYEPFMRMCCGHCRPLYSPNVPFHHSGHYVPSILPPQQMNTEKEVSQKSVEMGDASETQSTPYSVSPSIQSHITNSQEEEQPLSTGTLFNKEMNEQNQSILSFPDHDTPLSQQSEEFLDDDSQLKLDAQVLVDDSIQDAQDKYQRILRMSIDQDNTSDPVKQTVKNQSKSVVLPNDSNQQNLTNDKTICQELCNKLNLSDANQIDEIIQILASTAPHILKEPALHNKPLIDNSNTNKENENTLCKHLLLHPPFKPKRLIHLCADGSIQVLSAVDENSPENQTINQQQYRLNYSNSAVTPPVQQHHIVTNESSLALEYETTTTAEQSHLMINHNSILSLQQKQTLLKCDTPLEHTLTLANDIELNEDDLKLLSLDDNPIVRINLDLSDETIEANNEDEQNSLPEIFFKRIIAAKNSEKPNTDRSSQNIKNEEFYERWQTHSISRHHPQIKK